MEDLYRKVHAIPKQAPAVIGHWGHKANADTFLRLAGRLRELNVPDVDILDILTLAYQTTADEFMTEVAEP